MARLLTLILVCSLTGAAAARTLPERPAPGEKPDFHVLAGAGGWSFDFDPQGADGAPDLDGESWGGAMGVGWTWPERLRLEAQIGGWPVGRDDAWCLRAHGSALVPVVGGLSAVGSLGVVALMLDADAADDQTLEGIEVGVGAAWTMRVAGRISLEGRYVYLSQRYFEKDLALPDAAPLTIHPDATAHLLSVGLILDL